jgi:uncharacterized protein YegP (UPF0339 family)
MPAAAEFEVYRDGADEWRWRLRAPNGNVVATSGEGYVSKQGVERGIRSVRRYASEAEVVRE